MKPTSGSVSLNNKPLGTGTLTFPAPMARLNEEVLRGMTKHHKEHHT